MPRISRHHASVVLSLAVTAIFLSLALRKVEVRLLWPLLSQARLGWLAAMLLLTLLELCVRPVRWRILLSPVVRARIGTLFGLEAMGLAVNNILFLRLGEVARAFLAARELDASLAAVAATIFVERLLDTLTLLALFCLAARVVPSVVPAAVAQAGPWVLGGGIAALAAFVFFPWAGEPGSPEGEARPRKLASAAGLKAIARRVSSGGAALRDPRKALAIVAIGFGQWLLDVGVYWAAAKALGLSMIDLPRALLVLAWASAGAALPAAPGSFGTFEAMVKDIAARCGASATQAFGYAFFTHMLAYILITSVGLAFIYKEGLSLESLKVHSKNESEK